MSGDQELPYAQLVRDWAEGKTLPTEVQAIKDWLQQNYTDAEISVPSVLDEVAEKAEAERWHPDSVHAALLIISLISPPHEEWEEVSEFLRLGLRVYVDTVSADTFAIHGVFYSRRAGGLY